MLIDVRKINFITIARSLAIWMLIVADSLRIVMVRHIKQPLLLHPPWKLQLNHRSLPTPLLHLMVSSPRALQQIMQALSAIGFSGNNLPCSHGNSILVHQIAWLWCNNICPTLNLIPDKHVCIANGDKMQIFDIGQGHFSSSSPLWMIFSLFLHYLILLYPLDSSWTKTTLCCLP